MKTKNIFRMLLVAVTLLLGANNVKAEETYQIWPAQAGSEGSQDVNGYNNAMLFSTSTLSTNHASHGDVLRVIATTGNNDWGDQVSWSVKILASKDYDYTRNEVASLNKTSNKNSKITIEIPLTSDAIEKLIEGRSMAFIETSNLTLNQLSFVIKDGYPVFINQMNGGSVTADKLKAVQGDVVNLTINTWDGYIFNSVTVTDANDGAINVENDSFSMPGSSVTITPSFSAQAFIITTQADYITADKTSAAVGETVTLSCTPPEGYTLLWYDVKQSDNQSVQINNGNQFTMPNSNVNVRVALKLADPNKASKVSLWPSDHASQAVSWNDNNGTDFSTTLLSGARLGDIIRVIGSCNDNNSWNLGIGCRPDEWNLNYVYTITTNNQPNEATNWNSNEFLSQNNYIDFVLTNEAIDIIRNKSSLFLRGQNFTATSVKLLTYGEGSGTSQEEKQASSIIFDDDVEITFGEEFTAPTVTTTPENATLIYSSSDINVVSIIDNTVVPVGAGVAKITATFAGDDEYNGTSAYYNIKVNAPLTEGALWAGAGYLGDWAAEERGNVGINVGIPDGTFESVELGDTLRFHAKLGPLDANNWAIQMANGGWDSNIFDARTGNDGFASGYYDVVVDTDEFLTKLKTNGTWGSCAYVQGYNLTLTAITLRKKVEQTITDYWTVKSTAPEAGATLKNDGALTINTVYGTTAEIKSVEIHGKQFDKYIEVRVEDAPTSDNRTGTESSGTPITIVAKRNTTIVVYYQRQSDGSNDWNYTSNSGKDLKLIDQANPTTAIDGTISVSNADAEYGYVAKTYTLEAGKTYTLWSKGTTVKLYGIYYSTEASNVQVTQNYKIAYMNDDNTVFYATWLAADASIPSPSTEPTKEGYTFNGWKDAGGNDIPSTMPSYDLIAYPYFTKNEEPLPDHEYISVDFGDYDYRTYVTTIDIDFSLSIGIKGYYATGLNDAGTEVLFTEVTGTVSDGTPLLLVKESNASEFKLCKSDTEGNSIPNNKLRVGQDANVGGSNIYVLTYHTGYVFAETNYKDAYVDRAHAYLDLGGSNARGRLSISFGNGEGTTGIENFNVDESDDMQIYDLKGQRVNKPTKGLYIINGKKVLIK